MNMLPLDEPDSQAVDICPILTGGDSEGINRRDVLIRRSPNGPAGPASAIRPDALAAASAIGRRARRFDEGVPSWRGGILLSLAGLPRPEQAK
jgi:hypothetical protein